MEFFFRGVQLTLNKTSPISKGLHYQVNQKAIQESAEYVVRNFSEAMIFNKREELWEFCIEKVSDSSIKDGIIAEFGVYKGESINFFARRFPQTRIFGFDSFEGLEEDWHGFVLLKGTFSTAGVLPVCENNVELFKGWFENTLPSFISKIENTQIKLLHMDADTYKPTAYVLSALRNNLRKGTVIIFDEYFGYTNYRMHEFKAWQEFVNSANVNYKYIGYTEMQVAVQIL